MAIMKKMAANLWFDHQAEEAVKFYTSVFKNSSTGRISRYGKEGHETHKMEEGTVMTIEFELEDQAFLALNAGPEFKFNESVSFVIHCDDQDEVDYYWDKLSEGGDPKAQACGWLKDQFGLSWQIVPSIMPALLASEEKERTERVMKVVMGMKKPNISELQKAYQGQETLVAG
jgi:predicted 3-demethylubiquinone-9 3-methyltransferase (glyoxalase superfamily)